MGGGAKSRKLRGSFMSGHNPHFVEGNLNRICPFFALVPLLLLLLLLLLLHLLLWSPSISPPLPGCAPSSPPPAQKKMMRVSSVKFEGGILITSSTPPRPLPPLLSLFSGTRNGKNEACEKIAKKRARNCKKSQHRSRCCTVIQICQIRVPETKSILEMQWRQEVQQHQHYFLF